MAEEQVIEQTGEVDQDGIVDDYFDTDTWGEVEGADKYEPEQKQETENAENVEEQKQVEGQENKAEAPSEPPSGFYGKFWEKGDDGSVNYNVNGVFDFLSKGGEYQYKGRQFTQEDINAQKIQQQNQEPEIPEYEKRAQERKEKFNNYKTSLMSNIGNFGQQWAFHYNKAIQSGYNQEWANQYANQQIGQSLQDHLDDKWRSFQDEGYIEREKRIEEEKKQSQINEMAVQNRTIFANKYFNGDIKEMYGYLWEVGGDDIRFMYESSNPSAKNQSYSEYNKGLNKWFTNLSSDINFLEALKRRVDGSFALKNLPFVSMELAKMRGKGAPNSKTRAPSGINTPAQKAMSKERDALTDYFGKDIDELPEM